MYIDLLIPSRQDFPQNYILQFPPDDLKRECFLESHVQKNLAVAFKRFNRYRQASKGGVHDYFSSVQSACKPWLLP